jgi:hypothetical protein
MELSTVSSQAFRRSPMRRSLARAKPRSSFPNGGHTLARSSLSESSRVGCAGSYASFRARLKRSTEKSGSLLPVRTLTAAPPPRLRRALDVRKRARLEAASLQTGWRRAFARAGGQKRCGLCQSGPSVLRKLETEPIRQDRLLLTPGQRLVRALISTCGSGRNGAAPRVKQKQPRSCERGRLRWVSGTFVPSSGRYFWSDSGVWNPG